MGVRVRRLPLTSLPATTVSEFPAVDLRIYPYECDAYGHLNEAGFLQLFERARWDVLARGPGADLFSRNGVWPAVRHAVVDYHRPAFPGDVVRVDMVVEKVGRTSLEMRQRAVSARDGELVAELQVVFVMIDKSGNPMPMPDEVTTAFGGRTTVAVGEMVRHDVGEGTLAVDARGLTHRYASNRAAAPSPTGASGWAMMPVRSMPTTFASRTSASRRGVSEPAAWRRRIASRRRSSTVAIGCSR